MRLRTLLGRRSLLVLVVAALGALSVAGCGSSSGTIKYAGLSKPVSATPPNSGCGSYKLPPVQDPDKIIASLSPKHQEIYDGYYTPVRRSAWADWKPKGDPPYTVGIQWASVNTGPAVVLTKQLRSVLGADKSVGKVIFQSTENNIDVGQQISQLNAMILKKPDIIILQQLQGDALKPLLERAGRAGIPTLLVLDRIDTPYGVAVHFNQYAGAARSAARTLRQAGSKGNALVIHGVPGSGTEVQFVEAFEDVLKRCPDFKKVGDIYADFQPTLAKSDTLRFLGTHPEPINAALVVGATAAGAMSAFEQSGRPMPVVQDPGPSKGGIGYWSRNKDIYHGAGTGIALEDYGRTIADVALRMLAGQGLKLTDVVGDSPLITDANLSDWATDPTWKLSSPDIAPGPADGFADKQYLDALFNNPQK